MPRIVPTRIETERPDGTVAGLLFLPPDIDGTVPLVLMGHGANTGKDDEVMQILCRQLCRGAEAGVLVIDCPGHGERIPPGTSEPERARAVQHGMASAQVRAQLADDWRAAAAAARAATPQLDERTGYAGFSMGSVFGFTVVPALPEISCALLALGGLFDEAVDDSALAAHNARANEQMRAGAAAFGEREVLMLNMTRDEHFPMSGAIEAFELIPGPKRMGVWSGTHIEITAEAVRMGADFLKRCLSR